MKNIKILFEAKGSEERTVDAVCNNFYQNYSMFACNMEEEEYKYNKKTKEFCLLWSGDFDEDDLNEDNMDMLLKLTHHAEGFYNNTDAVLVHVEVCIDGEWYGR